MLNFSFLVFCSAYLCCTKCRYSSCCSRALSIHVQLFHGPKTPQFTLGHPSMLPNEVFCVCGFSTKSGNKMGMSGLKSTDLKQNTYNYLLFFFFSQTSWYQWLPFRLSYQRKGCKCCKANPG